MNILKSLPRALVLISVFSMAVAMTPLYAMADGCGDIETSVVKCDTTGGNPVMSLVMQVTNFLAIGVGIAVVGGIVWGAFLHATSNGDASQTKQAINIIVNAVIGLLLFMFAWAFINFLVPGGIL